MAIPAVESWLSVRRTTITTSIMDDYLLHFTSTICQKTRQYRYLHNIDHCNRTFKPKFVRHLDSRVIFGLHF
jgi:hypothetical protein